ncbi:hypothetical protein RG47T_2774 [Mucilaginibacter polytrichastri]|uniref:Uncharacterized protein n=1 Tax=Mucilaginibacter polytrichastri TaxID=1302689 RepID=A0A1Q5ZZW5_9SPHI|nr:hypothetical protein RG47T_2774 [Mucilaginibacter polytrichastri]SFT21782.1 hypothetical protein SAMN04487890_11816 [Mucilaginibacter polytrichastri]
MQSIVFYNSFTITNYDIIPIICPSIFGETINVVIHKKFK